MLRSILSGVFAILFAVVFAFINIPAHAQVVQIMSQDEVAEMAWDDITMSEATTTEFWTRFHWGYPDATQIGVTSAVPQSINFEGIPSNGDSYFLEVKDVNQSPRFVSYSRNSEYEGEPVAIRTWAENGGTMYSSWNKDVCKDGPLLALARSADNTAWAAIDNHFTGSDVYYRRTDDPNSTWYKVSGNASIGQRFWGEQGTIEIKLSPDSSQTCATMSWDWTVMIPPVEIVVESTTARVGQEIVVPVSVRRLMGREFATLQAGVKFDATMLQPLGVERGYILDQGSSVQFVQNQDGNYILGVLSSANWTVQNESVLVFLRFRALKKGPTTVSLEQLELHAGQVPAEAVDGTATITDDIVVSGHVQYYTFNAPVSDTIVSLEGFGFVQQSNQDGNFEFQVSNGSSFTLRFEKEMHGGTAVSALDAALVERCSLGMTKLGYPGECLNEVLDVDQDGQITLLDSWYILRFVVGYRDQESRAGEWMFIPGDHSFSNVIEDVYADQVAHINGDATGNGALQNVATASNADISLASSESGNVIKLSIVSEPFNGVRFVLKSDDAFVITKVEADGFNTVAPLDGVIALERAEQTIGAAILIEIDAPNGAKIDITDFQLDESQPIELLGTAIVGPPPTTPHETTWLPSVLFQTEEEEMPILLPD